MSTSTQKVTVRTIIITGCVILAVLMLTALILNLVKLSTHNSRLRYLEQQIAIADREIAELSQAVDEKSTAAFIDEFVRDHLNMCGEDEIVFIGK